MRQCIKCLKRRVLTFYYRSGHHWSTTCKLCHRLWAVKYKAKYRALHPYVRKRQPLTNIDRAAHSIFRNTMKRSIGRRMRFTLTDKLVVKMVNEFCEQNYYDLSPGHPFRPSLDRVDKKKGYVTTNVRVIWYIENLARNVFDDAHVLEFCKRKLTAK